MDPVQYPNFNCKVWLMEALRRAAILSNKRLDIAQVMAEVQNFGLQNVEGVMKYGAPIAVVVSQFSCD